MKHTNIDLQTLQDEELTLFVKKNTRGGISSVMGDRCVKSEENKKFLYIDANNLYGFVMSQPLSYDENKFDKNANFEDIFKIFRG